MEHWCSLGQHKVHSQSCSNLLLNGITQHAWLVQDSLDVEVPEIPFGNRDEFLLAYRDFCARTDREFQVGVALMRPRGTEELRWCLVITQENTSAKQTSTNNEKGLKKVQAFMICLSD